jgi:hypothetical protein
VVLFDPFCHRQIFPSSRDILIVTHVARRLRLRLGDDICSLIEHDILTEGMQEWSCSVGNTRWAPAFNDMTKDERGMMVIFIDVTRESSDPHTIMDLGSVAFQEAKSFLTNPAAHCPEQADVIDVASIEGPPTRGPPFDIPNMEPDNCICGKCLAMSSSVDRNGCDALEMMWNPLLNEAEQWVDTFMN